MKIKFYSICFIACFLFSLQSMSQPSYSGSWGTLTEKANTPIDEMIGGYIEVLPYNYNPTQKYPLLVFFEGQSQFGDGGTTDLKSLYGNNEGMLADIISKDQFPNNYSVGGQTYSFIVIIPQLRDQVRSRPGPEAMASPAEVNDVINYAMQYYSVDPTRVYLSGLSLGGGSTWNYPGASVVYGNRLAAIVPLEGASNLWDDHSRVTNIAASNLPVWTFSGDDHPFDTLAQRYIDSIKTHPEYTADALITIYSGVSHNSWGIPLGGGNTNPPAGSSEPNNIYVWMLEQSRPLLTSPAFATVTATVDQGTVNLANGSMVLGPHDISFNGATVTLTGIVPSYNSNTQTIEWKRIVGNGGTITSPGSLQTTVTNLKPGYYVFQLRVTNNGTAITSVANVSVTVNAPPDHEYTKIEAETYTGRGPGGDFNAPTIDRTSYDNGPAYSLGWFVPGAYVDYTVTPPTPGSYALYYRYISTCGCSPTITVLSNGSTVATKALTANGNWISDSIHINLSSTSTIEFQATTINFNYFELALLSSESPLPIKFVYFNSQCNGSGANLQWKTAQELNSKSFDIQRSVDGINWSTVSSVAAAGQSSTERTYHYSDNSSSGSSFYRIVENDLDGRSSISSIVRSSCQSGLNGFSVSPNPVSGSAVLSIHLQQGATVRWKIIDSKGAMVQQNQMVLPSGSSSIPLNLSNYSKGIYSLSLYYNNEMKTIKLIKK